MPAQGLALPISTATDQNHSACPAQSAPSPWEGVVEIQALSRSTSVAVTVRKHHLVAPVSHPGAAQ